MKTDMTQGKILPVLLKFTLPILFGDLFQQFYNIADTIIVGRTLGSSALAAVGSTGTIMFFLSGITSALVNGFSVVTSQKFGAKEETNVRKSFGNGIFLLFAIILPITLLLLLTIGKILVWMNTPEDIYSLARNYISVIIAGLIAMGFYNYCAANLRAIGNSRVPLYFLIFASGLNIVLDLLFILGLHMSTEGAALATILSQLTSALCCFFYIIRSDVGLIPHRGEWKADWSIMKEELHIGVPMALQNAITASGSMVMQSAANIFGSTAVAANTAAEKCRTLFTQPMISMGQSIAMFVGQNYGNKDIARVRKGTYLAMKFMIFYGALTGILVNLLLPFAIRLFVSDTGEITAMLPWATTYIRLCSTFFIPLGFIFIFRSALQGCGRSVFAMSAGFVELFSRVSFAMAAIYFQSYILSCLCNCAAWAAAGIYTLAAFTIITGKMEKN